MGGWLDDLGGWMGDGWMIWVVGWGMDGWVGGRLGTLCVKI